MPDKIDVKRSKVYLILQAGHGLQRWTSMPNEGEIRWFHQQTTIPCIGHGSKRFNVACLHQHKVHAWIPLTCKLRPFPSYGNEFDRYG